MCWGLSESVLSGFTKNCIVLNNRIYEPSLIVHDPLRGTTAIFCGQDLNFQVGVKVRILLLQDLVCQYIQFAQKKEENSKTI